MKDNLAQNRIIIEDFKNSLEDKSTEIHKLKEKENLQNKKIEKLLNEKEELTEKYENLRLERIKLNDKDIKREDKYKEEEELNNDVLYINIY